MERTHIRIPKELKERAREYDLNISAIARAAIQRRVDYLDKKLVAIGVCRE